ncbi:MAG: L,D-transpeptidase Cds6 family protein [Pseudomonadota bacterium]
MRQTTLALALLIAALCGNVHAAPGNSETQLAKSIRALQDSRLDVALNEVDDLLRSKPNFKLAQLVKGDLLMARAGAVSDFGSLANAPRDKIADLREEAKVRLQRAQTQADSKRQAPGFLWQLDAQQKYALVVDTGSSSLFVYENVNGEPRYLTDFYITIGKLGTEKFTEGDQRTPIGIYFVTSELFKEQLADLYGNGAFPLNYPNEWDQRTGRGGSGIWLHGTPSDTYSRPPRASNGCVVLSNEDLDQLTPYLQVGITPVIITKQMSPRTAQDQQRRDELLQAIEQWRNDWASLDTDRYLAHYSNDFSSGGANYAAWAQHKARVNAAKSWIKLDLSNISLFNYPEQPNVAVVNFEQDYNSNNLSNRMKKRQYWIKQGDTWKIIYEGAA